MAFEIRIPRLGWSMEEGVFEGWLKVDGDFVKAGDPIFSVEGEKATQDVEATDSGVLCISPDCPEPGDVVPVGTLLGCLVALGEPPPWKGSAHVISASPVHVASPGSTGQELESHANPAERVFAVPSRLATQAEPVAIGGQDRHDRSIKSTPRARRAAARAGVNWKQLTGTGRGGRVRERDVLAAASTRTTVDKSTGRCNTPTESDTSGTSIPITPMRRTIAERMLRSAQSTAPVTLTTAANATNLVNLRQQFLATEPTDAAPSYTDMIVKLAATALRLHPIMNSRWTEDRIEQPSDVHVGVAVQTEAGLYVIVIRQVGSLTLRQVAAQSRQLIERARLRQLKAEEMSGSTFTVTNLGSYGVDAFTPIINPPECAVLGVGRIARRPAVVNEQVIARDEVKLSLTFDHRIVDGAPAASFLQTLVKLLENPAPALLP